jgi:hypothetical protein
MTTATATPPPVTDSDETGPGSPGFPGRHPAPSLSVAKRVAIGLLRRLAGLGDPVADAAATVGHFVCPYCYPNPGAPATSFCGSQRPPRLVTVSGEHLTKCPLCWARLNAGGFCVHYAAPFRPPA